MTASRIERFFAGIDEALAALLNAETPSRTTRIEQSPVRIKSFWVMWGRTFLVLNIADGSIAAGGHSWQTEHVYDSQGELVERKRYVLRIRPDQAVIYGLTRCYNKWREQYPGFYFPY